jgi:hemerythrin-like domain-containing protein
MTVDEKYFDAREMDMLHRMFRREFSLMSGLVRAVPAGDRARQEVISGHLSFMNTALHNHHTFEDEQVWPVLFERCSGDTLPEIQLIEQQHEQIEASASRVAALAAEWSSAAAADSRDRLADALDSLVPLLLRHMEFEEEHVVPLMEKNITHGEWNRMIQAAAAGLEPTDLPLEFGMMMYEGDPEIVERTISTMPEELRPVIGKTALRAYEEHAARVHGTVTPPRSSEL